MNALVRNSLVSLGLLAALAACGQAQPLSETPGAACPSIGKFPSLDVQAPYLSDPSTSRPTHVVYAPSTLKVASDGTYNGICPGDYFREASLYAGTVKVATVVRSPANIEVANHSPFIFEWNVTPGKEGVPLSGETTVQLHMEFQDGTAPTQEANNLAQSAQVVIHSSTTP